MNTNDQNTNRNDRNQPTNNEQQSRDEEQFWAAWWREYAQTWK